MQEELALPTALKRAPVTRRYEPLCCYVFHPSFWPPGLKPGAPLGYWGALPPRRADHAASQYPNGVGTQGANDERMGIQMSTNVFETVPVRTRYGAVETNGVTDGTVRPTDGTALMGDNDSDVQAVYEAYCAMLSAAGFSDKEQQQLQEYMAVHLEDVGTQEDLQAIVRGFVYAEPHE